MTFFSKKIMMTSLALAVLSLAACTVQDKNIKAPAASNAESKVLNIQEWQTKNGARVLYVYAPGLPMLDMNIVVDAGSIRDGKQPGIANVSNGLLSHGAKLNNHNLSVNDISERFDSVGANFGVSTSKDYMTLSLRSLTDEKWLYKATETLKAIINAPTFKNSELLRIRKVLLTGIEAQKQSPSAIASKLFYKNLYGLHPYANQTVGTAASLKKITRKDLRAFYKKHFVARNTLVTIVGDINKTKAAALAERMVGRLAVGKKAPALAQVKDLAKAVSIHQEYPSSQTHITMGHPGLHRKDKDYITLYVANHILGGSGFGSRIMQEIREKRGLAYSSYSYFVPMLRRGPFTIGMQTSNKNTQEAKTVLLQTLKTFISEGPTEKELLHAQKNITGGFPLKVDSNSDISNYLSVIGFYHLPLTYLSDFNKKVNAVTVAKIKETIKRRMHPDKMVMVTVGTTK
ncbi:MAG: pitrilysin family protein [Woeseiaceae bacterium]